MELTSKTFRSAPAAELRPTNEARIARVNRFLATYRDSDDAANVSDLLADTMHWCHAVDLDFTALLRTAEAHFEAECVSDQKGRT